MCMHIYVYIVYTISLEPSCSDMKPDTFCFYRHSLHGTYVSLRLKDKKQVHAYLQPNPPRPTDKLASLSLRKQPGQEGWLGGGRKVMLVVWTGGGRLGQGHITKNFKNLNGERPTLYFQN